MKAAAKNSSAFAGNQCKDFKRSFLYAHLMGIPQEGGKFPAAGIDALRVVMNPDAELWIFPQMSYEEREAD